MTDTKKLKELAEKLAPAYQGPWESHRHSASAVTVGAVGEDGEYSDFIDVRISDYSAFDEHDDELGQWIAAANPKTILALLDEIDRLKAENEALRGALKPFAEFERVRSAMGGNAPREGILYGVHSNTGSAELHVEHMQAAQSALEGATQ
ncbi:TPA: ead/Ea22-like family protein [Pseudomonas aeruginosa]|uniref:ead/Ea22-like family protein n=1 Tax=Pseudomonas aeruginosa TaxID=287 RepID=UPI0009A40637|nr:ead/Ea22-like family protein [Pseudomonas aeruginosa]ELL4384180.1 ead/Ea22-like family protein [Pseudomonas aeruginosa]MBI8320710.1 ead/Ea22-like family protein [Pseudomonas aeruginosa]MEA8571474.1 ead/Ea22-like family protein [Pseudomonas aeruginosa]HCE7269864.1 ead/Ea22-like family protein [Pseudomonas aeruginosa]HCF2364954.1 ead/Ea22-like family protein [Pseudomonas aeruginosa]